MSEETWRTAQKPEPMLKLLSDNASQRKLRLFLCHCCRMVWSELPDASKKAVEVAERYVQGEATPSELKLAHEAACRATSVAIDEYAESGFEDDGDFMCEDAVAGARAAEETTKDEISVEDAIFAADSALEAGVLPGIAMATNEEDELRIQQGQCDLLREIFGNPFREAPFDPPSLSPQVAVAIARSIEKDHAFDRLPILADALEEAGCTDEPILSHCRGPGPHVRGCWVLDLVLGKE